MRKNPGPYRSLVVAACAAAAGILGVPSRAQTADGLSLAAAQAAVASAVDDAGRRVQILKKLPADWAIGIYILPYGDEWRADPPRDSSWSGVARKLAERNAYWSAVMAALEKGEQAEQAAPPDVGGGPAFETPDGRVPALLEFSRQIAAVRLILDDSADDIQAWNIVKDGPQPESDAVILARKLSLFKTLAALK